MQIQAYATKKIIVGDKLFHVLDIALPKLHENNIVVVTSKIVSICQGRVKKASTKEEKRTLIKREADAYLDVSELWKSHGVLLTLNESILIPSAGIDESNGNGYLILWPKNIHQTAADIWRYLKQKHHLKHLGIIITDSHTTPMRWGTTGMGLSWCGFAALKDYIGTPDIFGKKLRVTKANMLDGLASAAVLTMGEGNEQTPLAVIRDTPFIHYQDQPPTKQEIQSLRIALEEDIFAPLLTAVPWKKKNK